MRFAASRAVARNMDERLRQAQRAAALSGSREAIEALALEAARSGTRTDWIVELLRAWPRLKRGDLIAPDRLTYTQARVALEAMLQGIGWKQKTLPAGVDPDACERCGHRLGLRSIEGARCIVCGSMVAPFHPPVMSECPPERDGTESLGQTEWIPVWAWVSPDCNYYIEIESRRTATFFHWRDDPNTWLVLDEVPAPPRWWHINTAHINEHPFEQMGSVPVRWGNCVIQITEVVQWLYQQALRVLGLRDVATEAQQRRTQRSRRSPEHEDLLARARQAGMFYGVTSQQYKEAQVALEAFLRARRRRKKPPKTNPTRGDELLRDLERRIRESADTSVAREISRQLAFEQARRGLLITPFDAQSGSVPWPLKRVFFYFPDSLSAAAEYTQGSPAGDRIYLWLYGLGSGPVQIKPLSGPGLWPLPDLQLQPDLPIPATLENFWRSDGVQYYLRRHALRRYE